VATTGTYVNGLISASGNVTGNYLLANIAFATGYTASKIYNGTSEANIGTSGGNANISIGGTSNVAVYATTGQYITGVVSASGNIIGATDLYIGNGASTTAFANPIAIFKDNGTGYVQVAVVNGTSTASADFVTYGNNGDDNQSWMDMGFNGNAFTDSNYTITNAGDGYILAQGNTSFGGNMVLATGNTGTTRDIVFSFGFLAANEFVRFQRSTNTILPAANTTANIGSTTRYLNNLYAVSHIGTTVSATGNITGGNILTAGLISATANITGNYFIGNGSLLTGISGGGGGASISNGTSNVSVVSSGGNVTIGIGGTSNVVVVSSSTFAIGNSTVYSNPNTFSGNITLPGSTNNMLIGTITLTGNIVVPNGSRLTIL